MESPKQYSAFIGERLLASGDLEKLLPKLKARFDRDLGTPFLIFDEETGKQVDFDLRGSIAEIRARVCEEPAQTGPGRPRLGVVAREVTLLPRHWEWLESQSNGASATIRRLIEDARKHESAKARRQRAIFAAGRFLSAMAGNFAGYEEASRALYAGDEKKFAELIAKWPKDIRECALRLARRED